MPSEPAAHVKAVSAEQQRARDAEGLHVHRVRNVPGPLYQQPNVRLLTCEQMVLGITRVGLQQVVVDILHRQRHLTRSRNGIKHKHR